VQWREPNPLLLTRLTRNELRDLADRITIELPKLPESSLGRANALTDLRNIRYLPSRPASRRDCEKPI
jgi:hypothetical protein